jgi:type IV pilus assembly protein PilV
MLKVKHAKYSSGFMLIEALIGIAIFSVGIIGMMGMIAKSVQVSSDATYRIQASQLANQISGQMLAGIDRTTSAAAQLTAMKNNYSSPSGAYFVNWLSNVNVSLPNATATIALSTAAVTSAQSPSNLANISITWKPPGATTAHSYSTVIWIR